MISRQVKIFGIVSGGRGRRDKEGRQVKRKEGVEGEGRKSEMGNGDK